MEDYRNPDDLLIAPDEEETEAADNLFDELEPATEEVVEEPPKPKKKKKKTFKRKLKKLIRRFFKLPLLTRIVAGVIALAVIVTIIVLIVVLPKSCSSGDAEPTKAATDTIAPADTAESAASTATPEVTEPTATPYVVPTVTSVPTLTQTIKPNERDAAVPMIRSRLVELGYMEMPATNDELYDTATVNAIKRFQYRTFTDSVKAWDGYVGPQTYEKLFAEDAIAFFMKSGDTDQKLYDSMLVTAMQEKLVALGYLSKTNGSYDRNTVDAVRSFQKACSIKSDGVAGAATLKLLAAKVEEKANGADATAEPVITDAAAETPAP